MFWVFAEYAHGAAGALPIAFKNLDSRAFTSAVWAEEADDLSAADFEVDAAKGLDLPVGFGEAANFDDWLVYVHTSIVSRGGRARQRVSGGTRGQPIGGRQLPSSQRLEHHSDRLGPWELSNCASRFE